MDRTNKTLLIHNAWILTVDATDRVLENGWLLVRGNRIERIGNDAAELDALRRADHPTLDANGMILMPGLVNAHTHLFQTFTRGFADEKELYPWLRDEIWPFAAAMEPEDFSLVGALGCLENIKNGATALIDQHYVHTHPDTSDRVLAAMDRSGVRGTLCRTFSNYNYTPLLQEEDETILSDLSRMTQSWHGARGGRLRISVGPINPWGCTRELYQKTFRFAQDHDMNYQIHTAETQNVVDKCMEMYGMRNVHLFRDLGILDSRTQLAHAIWLDDEELDMVRDSGASVVHCAVANMYLADGIARVPEMLERGIPVSLGTDGPGSNNAQDMLEVLKTTAILHKVNTLDPLAMTPNRVLRLACREGAKAVGHDDLGSLEPGYLADMILVDWRKPHIAPVHDPASAVVFCANGNDVDTSIIDGRVVMRNRRVTHLDEEALIEECQQRALAVRARR